MRSEWQIAIAGSLAAALVASCAVMPSTFPLTAGAATAAGRKSDDFMNSAPQTAGSAETASEVYVLVPRQPGDPLETIRGGGPTKGTVGNNSAGIGGGQTGNGTTGSPAGVAAPADSLTATPSPLAPSACEETATVGLFSTQDRPVLATATGVYVRNADTWLRIANKFPCGTVPAAIAPAHPAWYAAAGDGIYRADSQSPDWTRVVAGKAVVDLDIVPGASSGVAVQEDGRPFLFDGSVWATQSVLLAPMMGGVRTISATESYAVGQGVLGSYNGQTWTVLTQPDAANPVAGLGVRRTSDNAAALVATTRAGLYRLTSSGWVAELGPDPSLYLGLPVFWGALGFVSDLGVAGGASFTYSAATWQTAPAAPVPLETSAVLPDGTVLALSADGESLHHLSGGAWLPVAMP